jgi:membrane protein implicated in regulation of membrane protease activity
MKHASFSDLPNSWWVAMVSCVIVAAALLYYTWRVNKK